MRYVLTALTGTNLCCVIPEWNMVIARMAPPAERLAVSFKSHTLRRQRGSKIAVENCHPIYRFRNEGVRNV